MQFSRAIWSGKKNLLHKMLAHKKLCQPFVFSSYLVRAPALISQAHFQFVSLEIRFFIPWHSLFTELCSDEDDIFSYILLVHSSTMITYVDNLHKRSTNCISQKAHWHCTLSTVSQYTENWRSSDNLHIVTHKFSTQKMLLSTT